jgi:putative FmdB family regulatory protein
MPSYNYKCPQCGHIYNEIRDITSSQFLIKCYVCKDIDYEEVIINPLAEESTND